MTITELAPLIRKRKLAPLDVTRAQLDRIASLDGRLKAYATVTAELALQQAAQAQQEIAQGRYRGLLHGVPVAVKDLRAMMRGIDMLVCPSTPREAFAVTPGFLYGPIPPGRDPWHARFTAPFNFSGLPTLSVPCGLSDAGLPLSIQFVGHALREDQLVGAGHAFEQASGLRDLHPPGW